MCSGLPGRGRQSNRRARWALPVLQDSEAADLGFRRVRAVRGCECGVLRDRSVWMEAEQELLYADHAVTLSP